jgi:hypothetical protein
MSEFEHTSSRCAATSESGELENEKNSTTFMEWVVIVKLVHNHFADANLQLSWQARGGGHL